MKLARQEVMSIAQRKMPPPRGWKLRRSTGTESIRSMLPIRRRPLTSIHKANIEIICATGCSVGMDEYRRAPRLRSRAGGLRLTQASLPATSVRTSRVEHVISRATILS